MAERKKERKKEDTFSDNVTKVIGVVIDEPKLTKIFVIKPGCGYVYYIIMTIQKKANFTKNLFSEMELKSGKPQLFINI
jgi:hypothetical protein